PRPLSAPEVARYPDGRRLRGLGPPMPNPQRPLPAGRRTPGRRHSTEFAAEESEGADAGARPIPITPDPRRIVQDAVVADDMDDAREARGGRADERGDQDADKHHPDSTHRDPHTTTKPSSRPPSSSRAPGR